MPKFGASLYCISRHIISGTITPEQGVEWLCENGAEVIEIVPFGFDPLVDKAVAARMKAVADKHSIPIDNYSLNANFLHLSHDEWDKEISRVKDHIKVAHEMGATTFRCDCSAYRRDAEMNSIEAFYEDLPTIVKSYEELCNFAAKMGITILIENHGFHVNGSDRVRHVIKSVKAKNFGHQLDVGNYICVDDKPEIATRKMMQFATTIHMKDFYVRNHSHNPGDATQFDCSGAWFRSTGGQYLRGAITGQGDLDMHDIIKCIKSHNFDGNIYIEYEGMEDCYYGTKVSLDNVKRIYAECGISEKV
ncbi:MAG: sugar phosphate isomerase/epimerase [Defluviitaleaceae bacterium]|nr:sugar phosphate isomerase/epimerase [Defluviitaleaceae bacterium]